MEATSQVDGHPNLSSGTGTNSSISSLDPTVVNILRVDFGFKLNGRSLDNHSAEASGLQAKESDQLSSLGGSASASKSEFQSFIDEAKIHEIGLLAKCLILLKAIISGNYGLEVAKQVLGKLIQTCKTNETSGNFGFLKAAFSAIALFGNEKEVAGNMKHLLRLSQGNITTELIIDEFKNIGDVDSRIKCLNKMQENLSEKKNRV
jgi:hypothetical protein